MKHATLIKKFVFSVGASCLLLFVASLSVNAMTVHLCAGGVYSVTTISVVPGPNGTFRHVSKTVNMGSCQGDWSYSEALVLAQGGSTIQVFEQNAFRGNAQVKQLPLTSPIIQTIFASWRAGAATKNRLPTKEVFLSNQEALREIERIQKLPQLRIVIPFGSLTVPRGVLVSDLSPSSD